MSQNPNFIDFTLFFNLIKESTSLNNENLFLLLLDYLYEDTEHEIKSPKDEVSDILRKKKAFNEKIRNHATLEQLLPIRDALSYSLIPAINNPKELSSKLLFLISKEQLFFERHDYEELCAHRDDLAFVISYMLIKTVSTSDKSKQYKHDKDYNPFKDYHTVLATSNISNDIVAEDLRKTSLFLYNKYTNFDINPHLLSNGFTYTLSQDIFLLTNSFSIVATSSNKSIPLESFMSSNENLLIIGEGGIGKTTILFSHLHKYHKTHSYTSIPLYVRLSDCSTNVDHEHIILNNIMYNIGFALNGHPVESYKDLIDEFSIENTDDTPSYTLLLDGFNEITAMDMGEIRFSIANEINTLLHLSNLRIILTSRESDLYGINVSDFTLVRADGIKKSDVISYLKENFSGNRLVEICENDTLLQYLQIPLFLKMFTYTESFDGYLPQTRGEILFHYYNGTNALYTEKTNTSIKTNTKTSVIINFLLDFLLPEVGFYMSENEIFNISLDELEVIIDKLRVEIVKYIPLKSITLSQYSKHPYSLKKVVSLFSSIDTDDIMLLLSDCLSILSIDADKRIYFCHQYIRDYFAALYCIKEIHYLTLAAQQSPNKLNSIDFTWGNTNWTNNRIELICEIINASSEYHSTDIIYETLKLFKVCNNNAIVSTHFALSNLINTLSHTQKGDLSMYDFSYLNLSECRLSTKNFHNPYFRRSSTFANSIISQSTFASEEHTEAVKKWTLSDDERYIASISVNQVIKIWNIANQKCIFTAKATGGSFYEKIKDFYFYPSRNFMLFTNIDENHSISCAWTFNTVTSCDSYYFTENPEIERFIYFGYDKSCDKLIGISDKSVLYRYTFEEPLATEKIPVNTDFTQRLKTQYLSADLQDRYYNLATKEVLLLANNKILYIESDVFPPYIHTISNKVYKGPEYALQQVEDMTDLSNIENIKQSGERHINFFIYDLVTLELSPLQLDCTPDEITTLVLNVSLGDDIIHTHVAISKDLKKIVIHNQNDLFIYYITNNDMLFKTICQIPHYINYSIKLCSKEDILTLFDDSNVYLFDLQEEKIIQEFIIGSNSFCEKITCTPNYRLFQFTDSNISFRVTNLYSGQENLLCLNDNCCITNTFMDDAQQILFTLYSNGTLIALNSYNMKHIFCYNLCPERHIITSAYSEDQHLLCLATSPHHSYLLSEEMQLHFFDIIEGYTYTLPNTFSSIRLLYFICEDQYIVIFTKTEIYIVSVLDKKITDTLPLFSVDYNFPVEIFVKDKLFYAVFSESHNIRDKAFLGTIIEMTVNDMRKAEVISKYYIPSIELKDIDTPIYVKQPKLSSLCLIKACDISNTTIEYVQESDSDFNFFKKDLNDWSLVYLSVPDVQNDSEYLRLRPIDFQIICNANYEHGIVSQNNQLYYYDFINNISKKINIGHNVPLYFNPCLQRIYLSDPVSDKLYMYDITTDKSPFSSPYLHPNILTNDCLFYNVKGYTGAIPRYLVHKLDSEEPL